MIILGLNINHADTSASIIVNGKIEAAIEEERFTRIKHFAGFPYNSIEFCLKHTNKKLSDVDYITLNFSPYSNLKQKMLFSIKNILSISTLKKIYNFKNKLFNQNKLNEFLKLHNFKGKIINVEHHKSHIASSYYNSNFNKSAGLTIDGFGDFCSTQSFFCNNNKIQNLKKVYFPHSLGILYQAITQFLGFKNYGDEYKVMGLAPYGDPVFMDEFNKLIKYNRKKLFELNLKFFSHHTNPNFSYNFFDGKPIFPNLYSNKIIDLLGEERKPNSDLNKRHFDIACSLQKTFEKILILILNDLYSETKVENLCLAGGCALNSKFNGIIKKKTSFKNIFIQPNAGDAGGSLGSATYYLKNNYKDDLSIESNCYLGSSFSNEYIEKNLIEVNEKNKNYSYHKLKDSDLYSEVTNRIAEGQIAGWFKGRCEWGPRALGNRSILADPRNPNMKEILNKKIKFRENFRPFAPSILFEEKDKFFELNYHSPFMLNVVNVKIDVKERIPAVVHVDNTCRVQTVKQEENYHFYNLISQFYLKTGIPILLNTSFNENEPIVQNPEEAYQCFVRTKMDFLILENWIISR